MTVRNDKYPYHQFGMSTYVYELESDGMIKCTDIYSMDPGPVRRRITPMDWDDFALFEPKPWIMQPGDLGLSS